MERTFWTVLQEHEALTSERQSFMGLANTAYQAALVEAAKAALPKGSKKKVKDVSAATKVLGEEAVSVLYKQHETDACIKMDQMKATIKALSDELDVLAVDTPFSEPHETWVEFHQTWSDTYRSTCRGSHYAKAFCLVTEMKLKAKGFQTKVEQLAPEVGSHRVMGDVPGYRVLILLNHERELELAKRKPSGFTTRDWLKACWGVGANPRVFNPFLPHGLEEKWGLDYFGGEIAKNGQIMSKGKQQRNLNRGGMSHVGGQPFTGSYPQPGDKDTGYCRGAVPATGSTHLGTFVEAVRAPGCELFGAPSVQGVLEPKCPACFAMHQEQVRGRKDNL